jgi:hypothetical protein
MEQRRGADPRDARIAELEHETQILKLRMAEMVQKGFASQGEIQGAAVRVAELEAEATKAAGMADRVRELEREAIQLRIEAGKARQDAARAGNAHEDLQELRAWKAQLAERDRNRETSLELERQQHAEQLRRLTDERDAAIRERDEARKSGSRRR